MSGDEIIGDIAQGALIARAVEPSHGEAADGHTHESTCLNCGTVLVGNHCHACGQAAHVHKTLGAFFHDLLHGVFHFEGKIWRTLPLLAWNPGRLTREYIDGRRASYVSPIALFLFVVFLTFALFNQLGSGVHFNANSAVVREHADKAEAEALARMVGLEKQVAATRQSGLPTAQLDEQLEAERTSLAALRIAASGKLPDGIAKADNPAEADMAARVNSVWQEAKANPDLALFKLQSSTYKYSWLLIPISVPFVWLLFPFRRRFHLYDHTVFVTYSLSFMLLVVAICSLAIQWNIRAVTGLLALYVPCHIYRQLRGTYAITRFGGIWRTFALAIFALIALLLFSLAILAVTIS